MFRASFDEFYGCISTEDGHIGTNDDWEIESLPRRGKMIMFRASFDEFTDTLGPQGASGKKNHIEANWALK